MGHHYREGDWCAVPLLAGGHALGLIARAQSHPAVLGYFFGPSQDALPTLDQASAAQPGDACLVARFSDAELRSGNWPVLGQCGQWDPSHWPMPVFVRRERLTGRSFRVSYDEFDPGRLQHEVEVTAAGHDTLPADTLPADGLPADGLLGATCLQGVLSTLLQ